MFENDKVYKIEVIENVMLNKVERGDSYSIYVRGNKAVFMRPRGCKSLFQHTLKNINDWLYEHCKIEKVETIEQWKLRTA